MTSTTDKRYVFLIYAVLVLATLVAFWPVRHNDFISFDDNNYIYDNEQVKAGLTLEGLIWAFTHHLVNHWHPLTVLSHMTDCQLFGLNAGAHHLVSVLLHIASTMLLFAILNNMTRCLWSSAFVAAVFGLHPLHVESVAWASERKDVLSALFWMLTIAAYLYYVKLATKRRYLLTSLAFVLGLMSKPMVVTLPFVLLLLDYWPLGRFGKVQERSEPDGSNESVDTESQWTIVFRLIREKIPFLVLSAITISIAYFIHRSTGVMKSTTLYPLIYRIENALVAYVAYIAKMLWPVRLAIYYPHPLGGLPAWKVVGSALLLALITVLVIYKRNQHRYLIVGWLWYLGTLVPVIGLVQLGNQAMADRYTYLPSIGIFIMISWGAGRLIAKCRHGKISLGVMAIVILVVLLICTRMQVRHWRNDLTLYGHAIEVTEDNAIMHNNFANALRAQGRFDEAISHFDEALRIEPRYLNARKNKGKALLETGRTGEAIDIFNEVLDFDEKPYEVYNDLGMAYAREGKLDSAIEKYENSLELKPDYSNAHLNLGSALVKQGKYDEAIKHYEKVLEVRPDWSQAYHYLGLAYARKGMYEQAIKNYNQALQLEPDNLDTVIKLAMALEKQGRIDEAVEQWKRALKIKPAVGIYFNLGLVLAQQGKYDDAIKNFNEALRLKSDWPKAYYCLGLAYAQQGKYEQAVKNYKEALRLKPDYHDAVKSMETALKKMENN